MVAPDCFAYGVGNAQDGLCLRVSLGPYRILLDCGLSEIAVRSQFQASPADLVLCSHAHRDHAQGLLALHRRFPDLPIYGSEVTTQLLPLNWPEEPEIPSFSRALPWRVPIEFGEGLTAELYPAGHLPGAAAFFLTYTPPTAHGSTYSIFYSGDFFLSHARLVNGLPLEALRGLSPDVLIISGSLGSARYPHRRQQENQLAQKIYQALENGQNVVLPLPPLGLAQEILLLLRSHHLFTGKAIDIWVDQRIAQACDVYLELLPYLPSAVQNFAQHQALFWDQRVRPHVRRLSEASPADLSSLPVIVLMDWDNPRSHLWQNPIRPWLMLLPGIPANTALMLTQLLDIDETAVAAGHLELGQYHLSLHSDGPATTQLIHNLRPQHVMFVHGQQNDLANLAGLEELNNRYHVHSPPSGSLTEFPLGEFPLQANQVVTTPSYEGELLEWSDRVMISLPEDIIGDRRWQNFADTGLVNATWQGDTLVLRGISQRELMRPQGDQLPKTTACCANCTAYRQNRCWNPNSALHSIKVAPDGYCPEFMPKNNDLENPPASEPEPQSNQP